MTERNWNSLVNTKFSLENEIGLQSGYVQELKFDSGKKRTWLKNSYIPYEYQLSLMLDNRIPKKNGKTEFEEFREWFNRTLRYGVLSFQMTRIGYKKKDTYADEMGVYKFLDIPKYDSLDGLITVKFGLEEMSVTPGVEYVFLAANNGQILLSKSGEYIIVS
jgi:hypothetical protein